MEINITSKKEKALLGRAEIAADMKFKGATPSREALRKALAGELKKDEKLVIIDEIGSDFGSQRGRVSARVYNDLKALEGAESKVYQTRMLPAEERKKLKELAKAQKAEAAAPAAAEK